jgi:hypothetical protein
MKRSRRLQLIRQLASDPDVASLLADIVSGNGIAAHRPHKPPAERKGVRYEVLAYVADAASIGEYRTARQIAELMEGAKYKFASNHHTTTVRESLRELEKERLVEKVGTSPEGASMWRKLP